jgi:hypothetical protein
MDVTTSLPLLRYRESGIEQGDWARLDSNQGPTDYESAALTS